MDSEIIYSIVGIIIFIIIIIVTLKTDVSSQVRSKDEKRAEIISEYKKQLNNALEKLPDNKEKRVSKKNELLKKVSDELALNIFFDKDEIREIISDLSKI